MIKDTILQKFDKRLADLPDEPTLSPAELKARFDACPEQLRGRHNALVDGLLAPAAAGELGFSSTPGVPADNVQAAITSVQGQLRGIALGSLPDGSIGRGKLTGDLTGELDTMHEKLDEHTQTDADLQSQINTKAEIVLGAYQGNNAPSRTINLGFTPKAVILTDGRGSMVDNSSYIYGGLAVQGYASRGVTITTGGFIVSYDGANKIYTNYSDASSMYRYIAFK